MQAADNTTERLVNLSGLSWHLVSQDTLQEQHGTALTASMTCEGSPDRHIMSDPGFCVCRRLTT